jgi:tellurite resistance protein
VSTVASAPAPRPRRTAPFDVAAYTITLGLAGLAAAWNAAETVLSAPAWPDEALFAASGALWLVFTAFYVWQGLFDGGSFVADLEHPSNGPFVSLVPFVGVLLSAHYCQHLPAFADWICVAFILALALTAARLFVHWLTGGVTMTTIGPGYFIPVVAGSFISSIAFSTLGAHREALGAIGAGFFFWAVIGSVVLVRLMTAGPLPAPAIPGFSAFLAAAATANLAWIVAHPGPMGDVQDLLTGVLVMMLLVQVVLIGQYRRLSFSLAFWVFTFPVATTTNDAIRWLSVADPAGRATWSWLVLGAGTAFIAAVGVRTLVGLVRTPVRRRAG